MAKRVLDVIGGSVLLVFTLPLWAVLAFLIKANTPGPVFFRQERLGLREEPFQIWKFRTMADGAERKEPALRRTAAQAVFFKLAADPRVTTLGRFLRRYSLDELPQLINVLKGEMSLVGPRPIRDFEFRRFDADQRALRFLVKPGLTCTWQVAGRSSTTDEQRLAYDLEYVAHWSLLTDIKLLFKTVPAVLRGDGAV